MYANKLLPIALKIKPTPKRKTPMGIISKLILSFLATSEIFSLNFALSDNMNSRSILL